MLLAQICSRWHLCDNVYNTFPDDFNCKSNDIYQYSKIYFESGSSSESCPVLLISSPPPSHPIQTQAILPKQQQLYAAHHCLPSFDPIPVGLSLTAGLFSHPFSIFPSECTTDLAIDITNTPNYPNVLCNTQPRPLTNSIAVIWSPIAVHICIVVCVLTSLNAQFHPSIHPPMSSITRDVCVT